MIAQSRSRTLVAALCIAATYLVSAMPAKASIIGNTITASGTTLQPASATIGSGVEFEGISGNLDFDFADSTLTITASNAVAWGGFGSYVFSEFDVTITDFSLVSQSGFSSSTDFLTDYSFTSNSITLNMNEGLASTPGTVAVFQIKTESATNAVPEPATLTMWSLGALGFAVAAFRRRKAT